MGWGDVDLPKCVKKSEMPNLYTCVLRSTQRKCKCLRFLCLLRGCVVLEVDLVLLGLHCFLRLSSAGLRCFGS